jgi:hypothetical protein
VIPSGVGLQPLSNLAPLAGEINIGAGGAIGGAEESDAGVAINNRVATNRNVKRRQKSL